MFVLILTFVRSCVQWQDGERRSVTNTLINADLFDDEASGEEDCRSVNHASTLPRETLHKRVSQHRARYSSVSSSFISSSEDEEQSEVERRFIKKRREVERFPSDDEESWSYARRSCRQRRQISYKFEEFDQLICGAIEDDVKEPDPTRKYRRAAVYNDTVLTGKVISATWFLKPYKATLHAHPYVLTSREFCQFEWNLVCR